MNSKKFKKMKKLSVLLIALLPLVAIAQNKYVTKTGHAKIFSHTIAEDITANNYKVTSTLNTETGDMVFVTPVQSFEFEKALMQKHFNTENFMNSAVYPKIKFKGKIKNLASVNWDKDGKYPLTVVGNLTIRDVTKPMSQEGTITIKNGKISASSVFMVTNITQYHVGKPTKKSKENNVADDIKVTYTGNYTLR